MDYIQFFTLFGTLITGFGFMYKELKGFEKDIRDDIKVQSARSDQLFGIFCDLQKQFYDSQKQLKDELLSMKKEHYEFMQKKK